LCTLVTPWTITLLEDVRVGKFRSPEQGRRVAGSEFAPIWSPKRIFSKSYWFGAEAHQDFLNMNWRKQGKLIASYEAEDKRVSQHFRDFLELPWNKQKATIAEYREKGVGRSFPVKFLAKRERHIDLARLFVELLGVTALAAGLFALGKPKEEEKQ